MDDSKRSSKQERYGGASRRWSLPRWDSIFALVLGLAFIGFIVLEIGLPLAGCDIKGNISVGTGERLYHVPGQAYYDMTRINWFKGERWFCSERAARAAGWRKARL